MGNINVLSFAVANLIAAGEVVDRPSSVIKELLENAIDSGATTVTVEIQNGGVTYMRVTDNGCGMEPDDLPVAIRRHATSKIKEAEDLEAILTLGFRGEALAAISSVSDMRIISRQRGAESGAMLEASAGNILRVSERAAAEGTTVIVENLFANVPARRKFLKKDVTEAMAVSAVVEKIALSKPDVSFKLIIDGNVKLETIGDGSIKNAVYSVFGREFASKLIPTELEVDGICVKGFIGRSDNVRANRNYQNFFINGRYVKSRTAGAALEQAYTSYIAPEKFPCCVLFLDINPATVDVNVHPAKLEVKFSNEKPVFEAIYYAVRNALEQNFARPDVAIPQQRSTRSEWTQSRVSEATLPIEDRKDSSLKARQVETQLFTAPKVAEMSKPQKPSEPKPNKDAFAVLTAEEYVKQYVKENAQNDLERIADEYAKKQERKTEIVKDTPKEDPTENKAAVPTPKIEENKEILSAKEPKQAAEPMREERAVQQTLEYRIIGEAFNSYVLVERGDTMLLIDKHAAHERIIFEELKAAMKSTAPTSQMLMLPLEIMMTSDEIQTLEEYKSEIEAIGFEFSAGRYSVNISAVPEGIGTDAVSDMLVVMAERIKSGTGTAGLTRDIVFEKALYQASCKAAIKAGREYAERHVKWIVDKLMAIPDITVCPHGRPVAMELSKKNLDRQFERT
ncbi:MAG: DNA mismatch repair endonuclease MutL [Ruminococcaceae bacterium]|nr:DNA mismatch repair endonuclease MutL [Oscillospiraceae bacterium]